MQISNPHDIYTLVISQQIYVNRGRRLHGQTLFAASRRVAGASIGSPRCPVTCRETMRSKKTERFGCPAKTIPLQHAMLFRKPSAFVVVHVPIHSKGQGTTRGVALLLGQEPRELPPRATIAPRITGFVLSPAIPSCGATKPPITQI